MIGKTLFHMLTTDSYKTNGNYAFSSDLNSFNSDKKVLESLLESVTEYRNKHTFYEKISKNGVDVSSIDQFDVGVLGEGFKWSPDIDKSKEQEYLSNIKTLLGVNNITSPVPAYKQVFYPFCWGPTIASSLFCVSQVNVLGVPYKVLRISGSVPLSIIRQNWNDLITQNSKKFTHTVKIEDMCNYQVVFNFKKNLVSTRTTKADNEYEGELYEDHLFYDVDFKFKHQKPDLKGYGSPINMRKLLNARKSIIVKHGEGNNNKSTLSTFPPWWLENDYAGPLGYTVEKGDNGRIDTMYNYILSIREASDKLDMIGSAIIRPTICSFKDLESGKVAIFGSINVILDSDSIDIDKSKIFTQYNLYKE